MTAITINARQITALADSRVTIAGGGSIPRMQPKRR